MLWRGLSGKSARGDDGGKEIQIQRKEIQIFRNEIQAERNKFQIRRNEIQIQIIQFHSPI